MGFSPLVQLGRFKVGAGSPPLIVAEMSGNHNGSLDRALEIVDGAAAAGAHAIKLQTYTADTMTLPLSTGEFYVSDPKNAWAGRTLYDLYDEAHTPWKWHDALFKRSQERGMVAFSSPFDLSAVQFLQELDAPCYKIASFETIDLDLIRAVASTGKPVIMSTGMASIHEISEAVDAVRSVGCEQLILLKCTSNYPADPSNSNLVTIPHMERLFGCPVGDRKSVV